MRLTRVYVEAPLAAGKRVVIEGSAANHITRVLRLRSWRLDHACSMGLGRRVRRSDREFRKDCRAGGREGASASVERESPLSLDARARHFSRRAHGLDHPEGHGAGRIPHRAADHRAQRRAPGLETGGAESAALARESPSPPASSVVATACRKWQRRRTCSSCSAARMRRVRRACCSHRPATLRIDEVAAGAAGVTVLIGPEGGLTETEHETAIALRLHAGAHGPARVANGDGGYRRSDDTPARLRGLVGIDHEIRRHRTAGAGAGRPHRPRDLGREAAATGRPGAGHRHAAEDARRDRARAADRDLVPRLPAVSGKTPQIFIAWPAKLVLPARAARRAGRRARHA